MTTTITDEVHVPDELRAEIREAVARGAALLDERLPGWAEALDPGVLALDDCRHCVVGQAFHDRYLTTRGRAWRRDGHVLFGGDVFNHGLMVLGLERDAEGAGAHGFMLPPGVWRWASKLRPDGTFDAPHPRHAQVAWRELQDAWEKLLADRGVA